MSITKLRAAILKHSRKVANNASERLRKDTDIAEVVREDFWNEGRGLWNGAEDFGTGQRILKRWHANVLY
jgi:hypothetical protein